MPTDHRNDAAHALNAAWLRHQRGDLEYAYAAYMAYLRDFPEDPTALHYLGILAQQTGRSALAITLLRKALGSGNVDMRVANHLGQIYARENRWTEAADCFRRAAELAPHSADPLNNLANVQRQIGNRDDALRLYRQAISVDPNSREAHYNLGKLLREQGAFMDAQLAFEQAVSIDPGNYRAHYELALSLEEVGDFPAAMAHYQLALQTNPQHSRSIANLLALPCFDADATLISIATEVAHSDSTNSEACAKLHQGIGKYFDRRGDCERAFTHFAASNAIQRTWMKPSNFQVAAARRLVAAKKFDADYFRSVRELGNPSELPLFIVGMPRSGTTLIEQVLSSHPLVHGAGELLEIPRLAAALFGPSPPSIPEAARAYLDHMVARSPPGMIRVIDKLPINYRHLGVIATLFPNSRIVHCKRDPRDVALSCFIEMFGIDDQDFTSLAGIADAIIEEADMMRCWQDVLPLALLEIDYHRFITDQEGETRRLLTFCGLSWDERCLRYFETPRSVQTPSRWQVKQPLYTSSDGRWRNYECQLQPAIELLERARLI